MKSNSNDLDDAMLAALLDWRNRNGRSWKQRLLTAWTNGTDEFAPHGSALRTIRNRLGPSWLVDLRPSDLDTEAASRSITSLRK